MLKERTMQMRTNWQIHRVFRSYSLPCDITQNYTILYLQDLNDQTAATEKDGARRGRRETNQGGKHANKGRNKDKLVDFQQGHSEQTDLKQPRTRNT